MKKKKEQIIVKQISDEIYKFELLVIIEANFKQLNKVLKRKKLDPVPAEYDHCAGLTIKPTSSKGAIKGFVLVLWLPDKKDFYTLLHEIAHIAILVFHNQAHMEINDSTQEAFAYYQEWLFRKIWRLM